MSGSPRTAADPMWADPTQPRTKAGQRLIASFPANCADCERPEFIRHVAQSILAIEQEAHDANLAPMTTWRGLCGHVWDRAVEDTEVCPRCEAAAPGGSRTLVEALRFIADWAHDCITPQDTEGGYGFADIEKMARAALAEVPVIPDELGAAWAAAEAALPEGHHIAAVEHRWQTIVRRESSDGSSQLVYEFPKGLPSYRAVTFAPTDEETLDAWGDTPAAALRALAARLAKDPTDER